MIPQRGLRLSPFTRGRLNVGGTIRLSCQPQFVLLPRYIVFPVTMTGAWILSLRVGVYEGLASAGAVPAEAFMDPIWDRGITWGENLLEIPTELPRLPPLELELVRPGQLVQITVELPSDGARQHGMLAGGALLGHRVEPTDPGYRAGYYTGGGQ